MGWKDAPIAIETPQDEPTAKVTSWKDAPMVELEEEPTIQKSFFGSLMEGLSRPGAAVRSPFFGQSPISGFQNPESIPTFKQTAENKYWDMVGKQSAGMGRVGGQVHPYLMAPGGMIASTAGMGADVATDPITYIGGAALGGLMKTPIGAALGRFATKERNILPRVHGEQWVDDVAQNTRKVAEGLDNALKGAYNEAYVPFKDAPVNSQNIVKIFADNNIPENWVKDIYLKIGDIDTVAKAQAANQMITQKVAQSMWEGSPTGIGGAYNPRLAAKNVFRGIKGEIRSGIGTIDKNAEISLREIDNLASSDKTNDGIYDRMHDLYDLVGRRGREETNSLVALFKSGLGGTSKRKIIKETPEMGAELAKYLKSPKFKTDLESTIKKSIELRNQLTSFRRRQFQKGAAAVGSSVAGGGGVIYFLNKLFSGNK